MPRLSDHFSSEEFRCRCDRCRNLDPVVDPALVDALEDLRRVLAQPLIVTSGYRCPSHNAAIGGSPSSLHLTGQAADLAPPAGWSTHALADAATRAPRLRRGGIGTYRCHVHVDVRLTGAARWSAEDLP
jgi:uncharacterized protein YcbK (DUF882 family)